MQSYRRTYAIGETGLEMFLIILQRTLWPLRCLGQDSGLCRKTWILARMRLFRDPICPMVENTQVRWLPAGFDLDPSGQRGFVGVRRLLVNFWIARQLPLVHRAPSPRILVGGA